MSLIDVDRLSIRFGERTVVENVSFDLQRGGRIGIIGESGSGKTLTALSIMGLLPDNALMSGTISLDGRPLPVADDRDMSAIRGKSIAMIFQEPLTALNPLMIVWRQIATPLRLLGGLTRDEARTEARNWCQRVGLPAHASESYPHQLSGGQRQRVGIAIALCREPALVIADEPTSALDVTVQRGILDLLSGLVDELGTSLIFVSHDLAVVGEMTSRLLVLRHGRIVETGETKEVFARPKHEYTGALVDSARRSSAVLSSLIGDTA